MITDRDDAVRRANGQRLGSAGLVTSLVTVADLGGVVRSQPFDVPGGPTIAFIEDPEGNTLVLVQQ